MHLSNDRICGNMWAAEGVLDLISMSGCRILRCAAIWIPLLARVYAFQDLHFVRMEKW